VASRKAGKTHAEAREGSRRALLRAGAEMLTETAQRNPFAGVRVREVCDRADYSTGAFYAHWPNAQAFYDELADYFMGDMLLEDFTILTEEARLGAERPGATALLELAEADLKVLLGNQEWDAVELLNLTLARTTQRDSARRGYRAIDEITGETYALILDRLDREPRPPLSSEHIGATLQALIEGFAFRAKVDVEGLVLPGAEDHTRLYAYAVAGLLCAMTRPRGDERGIAESLDDELRPTA
jgi:AcrR family transcriptional regulator